MQPIAAGTFVCEYAGEMLTAAVAADRLLEYDQRPNDAGHALLVRRLLVACLLACSAYLSFTAAGKENQMSSSLCPDDFQNIIHMHQPAQGQHS